MRELLYKYKDTFGENFPTAAFLGMSDEELIAAIKKCLAEDKTYVWEPDPDIDY